MSVHKDSKTNTWYFRKRMQQLDGSIRNCKRSGFKTKKEAQKAEVEFSFDDAKSKLLISNLWAEYYNHRKTRIKASTLYAEKLMMNKYILPIFSNKDSNKISLSDIQRWQNQLLETNLSINRINKICLVFSQLLDYGKTFYQVKDNPIKKLGFIKDTSIKEQKIDIWTKQEFETFIDKVEELNFKTLFYTLYYTGLRIGEALALTFNDIDLDNRIMIINKTVSYDSENSNQSYSVTAPKTKNGNRKIDLPVVYINFLKSYLTECSKIKHKQNDFLFGISKPLARTSIKRIKNEACKAAGVKQIRIHDFRHTHASMLIEKGVDPIYVKERLGHDDISTTLNTYSHLFKNRRKSIIETIENL